MENSDDQVIVLKFDKNSIKKLVIMLTLLTVICSVVIVSVIMYAPRSEGYNEMYLLDIKNQAGDDLSQDFVIGKNNMFDVQVVVVNNKPVLHNYQVQVKVVKDTFNFPINVPAYEVYEFTLDSAQSWSCKIPVVLSEAGDFSVVFELFAEKDGVYRFTDLYCVLHVNIV